MATKRDVILAAGFGVVAGAVGGNLLVGMWDEFQNHQSIKSLLSQVIDEIVIAEIPEMEKFKNRFVDKAEEFAYQNPDFIICPEAGKCEMRFDYIVPLTVTLGNEINYIIDENPELESLRQRMFQDPQPGTESAPLPPTPNA